MTTPRDAEVRGLLKAAEICEEAGPPRVRRHEGTELETNAKVYAWYGLQFAAAIRAYAERLNAEPAGGGGAEVGQAGDLSRYTAESYGEVPAPLPQPAVPEGMVLVPKAEFNDLRTLARQLCEYGDGDWDRRDRLRKAGKAFDAALAASPAAPAKPAVPEAVAWLEVTAKGDVLKVTFFPDAATRHRWIPLFRHDGAAAPAQPEMPEGTCPHCGLVLGQAWGGTPPCRSAWGGSPEAHPHFPHCVLDAAPAAPAKEG